MNDFINTLILLLIAVLIILAIIVICGLIYWAIWTALYVPINKKFKHDEQLLERNREYNKIEVEVAQINKLKEDERKAYEEITLKKQAVIDEMRKAEFDLKRKQNLIKEADEDFKLLNAFLDTPEGKRFRSRILKAKEADDEE